MRTKYCPHCGSENIERIDEAFEFEEDMYYSGAEVKRILECHGTHYHECIDCQEAWEHHVTELKCYGCGNCPYCREETS